MAGGRLLEMNICNSVRVVIRASITALTPILINRSGPTQPYTAMFCFLEIVCQIGRSVLRSYSCKPRNSLRTNNSSLVAKAGAIGPCPRMFAGSATFPLMITTG